MVNEKTRLHEIEYSVEVPSINKGNWNHLEYNPKTVKAFYFPLEQIILEENIHSNGSSSLFDKYNVTNGSDAFTKYLKLRKLNSFKENNVDVSRTVLNWVDNFYRAKNPNSEVIDLFE
ncbi:hypothetical protein HN385_02125 [archaeon]|nr:hypothetical protein [archaeon]MBT3450351.1 hypothetical protein [archaeon]MBT6868874.1 hypothetical protein [archaeon]MBT7192905.1 hypothetical protein [archaeon]MBT7380871.1 hypothetical protein [archaeon]